jgi:hypothetical protein
MLGARAANGEFLVVVDADTVVTPAVVTAAVKAMRAGAVEAAARSGSTADCRSTARSCKPWRFLYRLVGLASRCFLFCTRAGFLAVGGFDETPFGAEEAAVSRALLSAGA